MEWLNEPASWQRTGDVVTVSVDPGTDFWYETGYGYIRDNGHVYGEVLAGDLDVSVRIRGVLEAQYDQAGVMLRADERTWLKTGVEFFEGRPRLSTVLTLGRSSWMVTDLPDGSDDILLRVARRGDAVEVRYLVGDGQPELAALVFMPPDREVLAGVVCAAPEGPGFRVSFHDLRITEHSWSEPATGTGAWPEEDGAAWAADEGGSPWGAEDAAPGTGDLAWPEDTATEDDAGWAEDAAAEDDGAWPEDTAKQNDASWAGDPAEDDTGWSGHPLREDHPSWPGHPVGEDHPSWPGRPVGEDHPSWPGAAVTGPPGDDGLAEPGGARADAGTDSQAWAPAPTPRDWGRTDGQDAVADWDLLAAGAQAGAHAERFTAQTDADVANEWPGPPLREAGRAATGNGSAAADDPSSPAEPEPPDADGKAPDQTDPDLASAEPAPASRRKAAARPPVDPPGPPDPADEWISLLTADPAEE
jgi:regulation of enolase protein 1 (concanavalin A-like superfamily)